MPRLPRRVLTLAVLAVAAWTVLPPPPPAAVALPPAAADFRYDPKGLQWLGVGSCSAATCHNKNVPAGVPGGEYGIWESKDWHSKAYQAKNNGLFTEQSKRIEMNLKKLDRLKDAHPEKNPLCLKCHAMGLVPEKLRAPGFNLTEGVGCELCHGPAEKYIKVHREAGWQGLSLAQKAAAGMAPTKDLLYRAEMCAECHVGAADREVNHDLIAAGHPRLNFEFSIFQANMPHHWREKGENARADFEARGWALGQVASARAALELLEARAKAAQQAPNPKLPAGERPVWPEFAEYDCFACHHALRDEAWRREADFSKRRPGSYPWNTWYEALPPVLAKQLPASQAGPAAQALTELTRLMSHVRPDPEKVVPQAQAGRKALEDWGRAVRSTRLPPEKVRDLMAAVVADPDKLAGSSWDASAQLYNAVAALYEAQKAEGKKSPQLAAILSRLYSKVMEFPKGYDSPVGFNPDLFRKEWANLPKLVK
jgi:Cytochrome c554 and c-prime